MKIVMNPLFNASSYCLKFGKIVDHGTRDKDLIYVPILFEEPDSFSSSEKSSRELSSTNKTLPKSKFKKLLPGAGATIFSHEVVPEVVGGIGDKPTNVTEPLKNVATNSINNITNIKENSNKKSKTPNKSTNKNKDNSKFADKYDSAYELTPFSREYKSNNLNDKSNNSQSQNNLDDNNNPFFIYIYDDEDSNSTDNNLENDDDYDSYDEY